MICIFCFVACDRKPTNADNRQVTRADLDSFQTRLRNDLLSGLAASELEMQDCEHTQGQFKVNSLAAQGGANTFFTTLNASAIRFKVGLFDGLVGVRDPCVVLIDCLNLDLRAGTDDAESARKLSESLFRRSRMVDVSAFEVARATVRWGYSERTEGAIEAYAMNVQRTKSGWRITIKGGKFHQNWLSKLEIVNMVVACDADGLVFEKAELKQGESTVNFSGLRVTGGERPQVSGTVKISHLNLEGILPEGARPWVEGALSGDFRVSGSTNSADGIGFEGQVVLDGNDVITLRDKVHLLGILSKVDYLHKYHRVEFHEGTFQLKTSHGGMHLTGVKLKAGDVLSLEDRKDTAMKSNSKDLLTIEGGLEARLPTQEEIQTAVKQDPGTASLPLVGADLTSRMREAVKAEDSIAIQKAALLAQLRKKEGQSTGSLSLFDRVELSSDLRRLDNKAAEIRAETLRYSGEFLITVQGDVFDRGPRLQQRYPVDPATGRIPIKVPIDGFFNELTFKQAGEILELAQRVRN